MANATGGYFYDIDGDYEAILEAIIDGVELASASTMHLAHWNYNFLTASNYSSLATSADLIDDQDFSYYYGSGNKVIKNASDSDVINLHGVTLEQITGANIFNGAVKLTFQDSGNLTVLGQNNSSYLVDGKIRTANQDNQTWSL